MPPRVSTSDTGAGFLLPDGIRLYVQENLLSPQEEKISESGAEAKEKPEQLGSEAENRKMIGGN